MCHLLIIITLRVFPNAEQMTTGACAQRVKRRYVSNLHLLEHQKFMMSTHVLQKLHLTTDYTLKKCMLLSTMVICKQSVFSLMIMLGVGCGLCSLCAPVKCLKCQHGLHCRLYW